MTAQAVSKPKPAAPPKPADDEILGKAYDPHIVRRLLTYLRPYRRNLAVALLQRPAAGRPDEEQMPAGGVVAVLHRRRF